ncbi:MAG: adenine phosphoribosyltransferase [Deltaproteobacteria bacterium]|nr:adenine phosphoribosyltransferase [bacterium]MCB9475468.1 adenine phosphoribosyltransferase [Deltaproteobacteria bacterium]MCB9488529.1 adenine phosphoribosyltransferase [Deltaproteobacteria bacterium]
MDDIAKLIRNVPDWPKPGIQFKDITTMVANGPALRKVIDTLAERYKAFEFDAVVGVEARGFIFGTALAYALNTGFVLVRKPGKLPAKTRKVSYELEYGTDSLEIHEDSIAEGGKVLVIDDLLATGGTVRAVIDLLHGMGADVVEAAFIVELIGLGGRAKVEEKTDVHSLIHFEVDE